MATIYQVSELAGVSLATVSRVMNDSGKVSPKTRRKVEAAMQELGYSPNSIAQSLASRRSNSVGVLVPELHGPFFGVILSSIEAELRAAGKHVIITAGHSDEEVEKESIQFLSTRRCDALILYVYGLPDDYLAQLSESSVPIVFLNRLVPDTESECISLDNEHGGYIATKSLLDLGHREFAYISGPSWKRDSLKRLAGHRRALQEFGLELNEQLMFEGNYEEASGRKGMQFLLESSLPFSALICGNDEMAAGAMVVAQEKGLTIPDDFSVIGFDNVFFSRLLHPTLATIDCPIREMGRMAARSILKNVYGEEDLEIQYRFEPSLVRRASISPIQ
jgi:LacI family transcriptional regulator